MKIGDNISSAYGMNSLFGQSGQRNKQQPLDLDTSVRQSGAGLQPSTTPASISSTMWALQAGSCGPSINASDDKADAKHAAVIAEFTDLAKMTPAERIRAQILEKLGLTEDALKGMDQDQRAAVEKQIADEIKKQLSGVDDKDTDQQAGIVTA